MIGRASNPIFTRRTLSVQEYDAALIGGVGHTIVTGKGLASWQQEVLRIDRATLQILQEGAANAYIGDAEEGYISIVIGLPATTFMQFCGSKLDNAVLFTVKPGDVLTTRSDDVSRMSSLTLSIDDFIQAAYDLEPTNVESLLRESLFTHIPSGRWQTLVDLVDRLVAAADAGAFTNPQQERVAAEELIGTFMSAAMDSLPGTPLKGRPKTPRTQIIHKCRDLWQSGCKVKTVSEMANQIDESERTLRTAFQECFGMSPKQLLLHAQLHHVRKELMDAPNGATITQILSNHGIWELGRFAQRYNHVYGEYPSDTLK